MATFTQKLRPTGGLQVRKKGPGDMFPGPCLAEESVEGVVSSADGLVGGHLTVRLDTVLQAVEFPAGITDLDASLSEMNWDTLTLKGKSLVF